MTEQELYSELKNIDNLLIKEGSILCPDDMTKHVPVYKQKISKHKIDSLLYLKYHCLRTADLPFFFGYFIFVPSAIILTERISLVGKVQNFCSSKNLDFYSHFQNFLFDIDHYNNERFRCTFALKNILVETPTVSISLEDYIFLTKVKTHGLL
jgi:hypothetical protein